MRPILDGAFQNSGDSVQATVITKSVEMTQQSVTRDQGIAFLTKMTVIRERARGELILGPRIDSQMEPLHLRAIVKSRHRMDVMAEPFLRTFECLAPALLHKPDATAPETARYQV
jgi:hypothetical protein